MPEQPIQRSRRRSSGLDGPRFSRKSGVTTLSLGPLRPASRRSRMPGLQVQEIDGSGFILPPASRKARWCGNWCARSASRNATSSSIAMAAAVGTAARCSPARCSCTPGICKNVLVFKARNRYSQRTRRAGRAGQRRQGRCAVHHAFRHPPCRRFVSVPSPRLTWRATARRRLDFAHLAVYRAQPRCPQPKGDDAQAIHHRRPPELALDHLSPFRRLLDCCQESDGGVALVITSRLEQSARSESMRRCISCHGWAARVRPRVFGKPTERTRALACTKGGHHADRMSALPRSTIRLHSCA